MFAELLFLLLYDVGDLLIVAVLLRVHLEIGHVLREFGPVAVLFAFPAAGFVDGIQEGFGIGFGIGWGAGDGDDWQFFGHSGFRWQVILGGREFSEIEIATTSEDENEGGGWSFMVL